MKLQLSIHIEESEINENVPEKFIYVEVRNRCYEVLFSTSSVSYSKWHTRFLFEYTEAVEIIEINQFLFIRFYSLLITFPCETKSIINA